MDRQDFGLPFLPRPSTLRKRSSSGLPNFSNGDLNGSLSDVDCF